MEIIPYKDVLLPGNLEIIRTIVETHGIFAYPTDTLYGLGGNFLSPEAVHAVDVAKGREDMPYSAAVSGKEMLEKLVETVPPVFETLYEKLLPGKFTFLFKAAPSLDKKLLKGGDKIGIRIPAVPNILKLIEILGVPLLSTSVNRSGELPLNDPSEIAKLFSLPLLIDGGVLPASRGSTILDITESPIKCLRRGDDFHKLKQLNLNILY